MTAFHQPVFAAIRFETVSFIPVLLIGALGLAVVVHAYDKMLRREPRFGRRLLCGLRIAAVVFAVLSILHPTWVSEKKGDKEPQLAFILDNSISMAEKQGDDTRYELARKLLKRKLASRFDDDFEISVFDVNGGILDLDNLPKKPTEGGSPLTAGLLNVQRALGRDKLRGIVMLSDGREIAAPSAQAGLEMLRVPVFAVDLAAAEEGGEQSADLSVQMVIANDKAIVDNAISTTVLLASDSMREGQRVELVLMEGEIPVARKLIRWEAGEQNRKTELAFVPRRPGTHTMSVRARRVDKSGKELSGSDPNKANNWANFSVEVHPGKLTVLYVDGVLRWESKFIRECLDVDPDVNLLTAVRTSPREAASRSEGVFSQAQLANIDVVILGDIEKSYFDTLELVELRNWVTEAGGGLLLTGGYLNFGRDGFADSVLAAILPIVFPDPPSAQLEQPFHIRLTEEGFSHPIFHLTGEPVRDRSIWHSLPKQPGCCRIPAIKPGARVLAINPQVSTGGDGRGMPVIVEQQVGKGRTMVMAIDSTWQWRTIVGGYTKEVAFFRKFWCQTVRYLAPDPEPEGGHELAISTDRTTYAPDDEVTLFVEMKPKSGMAKGDIASRYKFAAIAVDENGLTRQIKLKGSGANRYEANFPAAKPGRQEVTVVAEPVVGGRHSLHQSRTAAIHVVHPDREAHESRPDPEWLRRVTQATGGRFTTLEEVEEWEIDEAPVKAVTVTVAGMWHHPLWAMLVFSLFCAEWILRRLSRLA